MVEDKRPSIVRARPTGASRYVDNRYPGLEYLTSVKPTIRVAEKSSHRL